MWAQQTPETRTFRRRGYLLDAETPAVVRDAVIAAGLTVLRPALMDPIVEPPEITADGLPLPVRCALDDLATLGKERGDPAGVHVDPADDAQFLLLMTVAPWAAFVHDDDGDQVLLAFSDEGSSVYFALADDERARVDAALRSDGFDPDAIDWFVTRAS